MHFEIENKYRVSDFESLREQLSALGASGGETVSQVDCYYRHPVRNFAQTDEAFRLRSVGEHNFLTYKGPKLDTATKSRYEREAPLGDGSAAREACDEILQRLGFEPVAEVRKERQNYHVKRNGQELEVSLDSVIGVGQFAEIEIQVEAATKDALSIADARQAVADLAAELKLHEVERRSYLELWLGRAK